MKIMKNDLVLERSVQLETWVVSATILKAEKRPEYDLVLRCIRDDVCTSEQIAKHLLFDDRARLGIAERMLSRTLDLKLTFKKGSVYSLTEKGYEAIEKQKIFIPEAGSWKVTFSKDSLLPFSVIAIEEHTEPTAMDEALHRNKQETEKRAAKFGNIPRWIKQSVENREGQPCTGGALIHFTDLKPKGENIENSFNLSVSWNVTKQSLTLYKGNKEINRFKAPERSIEDVWNELMIESRRFDSWRSETAELEEYFDNVPDDSRNTMFMDLVFPRPYLEGLQQFNTVTAKGVRLRPKTEACAQRWSEWLLLSSIDDYATTEKYAKWLESTTQLFIDFEVELPSRNQMAEKVIAEPKKRSKKGWHVVAAADWGL